MSLRLNLDAALHRRRMSIAELSDRTGVTPSNLVLLKLGRARAIRFETLEALCRELGCQPGELFSYEDDAAGE